MVGAQVPSIQPADGSPHAGPGTYHRVEIGYTVGIQHGAVPHIICNPVRDENIGNPDEGLIPGILRGNPNNDGELPGARGAQLSGKLRHDPHPNQQESQSMRF